jgi:hypothetical protein
MSLRFSYVQYDTKAVELQAKFKAKFEELESLATEIEDGRAKSLVMTKLEEAYMWVGKGIRDSQVKRNGSAPEQPERNNQ